MRKPFMSKMNDFREVQTGSEICYVASSLKLFRKRREKKKGFFPQDKRLRMESAARFFVVEKGDLYIDRFLK